MADHMPPLPGSPNPCSCCPPIRATLSLDRVIAVGFGYAGVTCDGVEVLREDNDAEFGDNPTMADAEALALAKPDADWRATFFGPLHGETYQRQGEGLWVLVEKNEGFA